MALQRAAGNRAVSAVLERPPRAPERAKAHIQRAPAAPGRPAAGGRGPAPGGHKPADGYDDYVDLINGFQDLAIAAINRGGRGLDSARFGGDLSGSHRRLLERVRKVLILAQEPSPDSKRTAVSEWPALERKLQQALAHARKLGIPGTQLDAVADNLALVTEKAVHLRRRGPSEVESPRGYVDLFNGIQSLLAVLQQENVDKTDAVVPLNLYETNKAQRAALASVQFGGHLTRRHRHLLEGLRTAFIDARTDAPGYPKKALAEWQAIQGQLRHVFSRAPRFVDGAEPLQAELARVGRQLIHGGVYAEAHNEALKGTGLASPDRPFEIERFREAAEEMEQAHKLAEKAFEMTGEKVLDEALERAEFKDLAGPILELAKTPGEIAEKLEEYKKRGVVGKSVTVLDMANKTLAFRNALMKVSFAVTKRFAERSVQLAIRSGDFEAVARWGKVKNWAVEHLEMLEKVEKVAKVIAIVVSAIKVIDYIAQGKWAEALEEAAETTASLAAAAAGGLGGTAMVSGIAVVLAAEAEAIHGAAAMIRYCKKASVREAAWTFIDVLVEAAKNEARDFVADVKLLEDPANAGEKQLIEQRIDSYVPYWLRHVGDLSEQLADTRVIRVGGQDGLRGALGPEAQIILNEPAIFAGSNWQQMAHQIKVLFAGANSMARYVVRSYPRSDRPEKKEAGGEE